MNQQQAAKFIPNLMDAWEKGQVNQLSQFYDPHVMGYYHGTVFGFAEIKNRMQYLKIRYPKQKHHVGELVLIDPTTVVFGVRQTGMDKYYKRPYTIDLKAI